MLQSVSDKINLFNSSLADVIDDAGFDTERIRNLRIRSHRNLAKDLEKFVRENKRGLIQRLIPNSILARTLADMYKESPVVYVPQTNTFYLCDIITKQKDKSEEEIIEEDSRIARAVSILALRNIGVCSNMTHREYEHISKLNGFSAIRFGAEQFFASMVYQNYESKPMKHARSRANLLNPKGFTLPQSRDYQTRLEQEHLVSSERLTFEGAVYLMLLEQEESTSRAIHLALNPIRDPTIRNPTEEDLIVPYEAILQKIKLSK